MAAPEYVDRLPWVESRDTFLSVNNRPTAEVEIVAA
jgi:hypothetical protein